MCKIIQFPTKKTESNGYLNLVALFEICDNVESCNFYLESVEELYKRGDISEKEMYTLRRIGRQKRLELANLVQEPVKAESAGVYRYTSEMGQKKPEGCQMEAGISHNCGHYWINTPLELKGRGIVENAACWAKGSKKAVEKWRSYTVTTRAFEKLKEQYAISMECCLD